MYIFPFGEPRMLANIKSIMVSLVVYAWLVVATDDAITFATTVAEDAPIKQIQSVSSQSNSIAPPADYYVATSGDDSGINDGSEEEPFATLTKASQVVQPGDLVYIRAGLYSIDVQLTQSGTSTNPITYQSYPGELAIFDGASIPAGTNVQIDMSASHNILRDIEVRNSPMRGILVSGDNNIIENATIHGNHHVGLQFFESSNSQAINVNSYNNYDSQNGGINADGIQALHSNDISISICRVYNNSDDGVDTFASVNITIDQCVSYQNGFDQGDGNGFKLGGGLGNSGSNTVTNNIAYNNKMRGFTFNGSNLRSVLLNNSSVSNPINFEFLGLRHVLVNNLTFDGQVVFDDETFNLSNSWNICISDPLFISLDPTSESFLQLQPNSPALEAGVDVGLPFTGAAPNIGVSL